MKPNDAIITVCAKMLAKGSSIEDVLVYLRDEGYSKGQSILLLTQASGKSLAEAKVLVHCSVVWSDVKARDESFHDNLAGGLRTLDSKSFKR